MSTLESSPFFSSMTSLCRFLETLHISQTINKTLSYMKDYLYEVGVVSEEQDLPSKFLPIPNPCSFFVTKKCNIELLFDSFYQRKPEGVKENFARIKLD